MRNGTIISVVIVTFLLLMGIGMASAILLGGIEGPEGTNPTVFNPSKDICIGTDAIIRLVWI